MSGEVSQRRNHCSTSMRQQTRHPPHALRDVEQTGLRERMYELRFLARTAVPATGNNAFKFRASTDGCRGELTNQPTVLGKCVASAHCVLLFLWKHECAPLNRGSVRDVKSKSAALFRRVRTKGGSHAQRSPLVSFTLPFLYCEGPLGRG